MILLHTYIHNYSSHLIKYVDSYDLYKKPLYNVIVQLLETPTIVLCDICYLLTRPMDSSCDTDGIASETNGTVLKRPSLLLMYILLAAETIRLVITYTQCIIMPHTSYTSSYAHMHSCIN